MKETELAESIVEHYSDWEVFKEVPYSGIIDIVCRKAGIHVAIECKTSLNFDVLEQALRNKEGFHFSYVAVPYAKQFRSQNNIQFNICRDYGIGVLCYIPQEYKQIKYRIEELVKPKFNRKAAIRVKLHDYMKRSVAGSQNDRMTAFKFTVEQLVTELKRAGGKMEIKKMFQTEKYHYSTNSSARLCIQRLATDQHYISDGKTYTIHRQIKEFYYEKGFLILTEDK